MISRRNFLVNTSAAVVSLPFLQSAAFATPLGLALGLQLYSVRQQMAQDLDGALAAVRAAGYTEVEAAALPKKSATEIRASLDKAGLTCVSAHHPFGELYPRFEEIVAFDKELGVKFMICSSPGFRSTTPPAGTTGQRLLSLDDWHYNAEQFNIMGEKTASAGIQFGYHNHVHEFGAVDGQIPYVELLRLTDPKKVTFELDCGWAIVAGADPVALLKRYPHRMSMLHVKDFKRPASEGLGSNVADAKDLKRTATDGHGSRSTDPKDFKVTELGQGSIDYRPIFAQAAKTQHIQHAFVEQEAFDMPWQQSLKVDADFLRALTV